MANNSEQNPVSVLICVKSCQYDLEHGAHDLIRDTWGRDVASAGMDLKVFMGDGATATDPDEVVLNAPDSYIGLPYKTRAIARYMMTQTYDYAFLCDSGSYVVPHHFSLCGFEKVDYLGYWPYTMKMFANVIEDPTHGCPVVEIPNCRPYASGGGYFLSRKALEIAASDEPTTWAEDLSVGQVLANHGVTLEAPDGFKGFVADWIEQENNYRFDFMENRTAWMRTAYEYTKALCKREGCDGPTWEKLRAPIPRKDIDAPQYDRPVYDVFKKPRVLETYDFSDPKVVKGFESILEERSRKRTGQVQADREKTGVSST
jgi:Galactosyltransferase